MLSRALGRLSDRARRTLLIAVLLIGSVCLLLTVAQQALRAYVEFRKVEHARAGPGAGVRPWMTVSYIAKTYQVPEEQLFAALNLPDTPRNRRAPLQMIARREGRDLNVDIATLNTLLGVPRLPVTPGAPGRPASPGPPPFPEAPQSPATR